MEKGNLHFYQIHKASNVKAWDNIKEFNNQRTRQGGGGKNNVAKKPNQHLQFYMQKWIMKLLSHLGSISKDEFVYTGKIAYQFLVIIAITEYLCWKIHLQSL